MLEEDVSRSKSQVICDTMSEHPIGASFPLYSRQYEAPSQRRKNDPPQNLTIMTTTMAVTIIITTIITIS